MIVMKFGGTSLKDVNAWETLARIVSRSLQRRPVVVVSAIAGITDQLVQCAETVLSGRKNEVFQIFERISTTHFELCDSLAIHRSTRFATATRLRELQNVLQSICTLKELTPATRDRILSFGELLSAPLVAAFLLSSGISARFVDSRDVLITDSSHGRARPDLRKSRKRLRQLLHPVLDANQIAVIPGFTGATENGSVTTLGRGGSDFSAAIIGTLLGAGEIQIWKTVPGFMTADPMLVPDAETISRLGYVEAEQLCRHGARVLHPLTVRVASRRGMPVRVLHTIHPDHPGTLISGDPGTMPPFVGITSRNELVTVVGCAAARAESAAKILLLVKDLPVTAIRASGNRMTLMVVDDQAATAVRRIHAALNSSNSGSFAFAGLRWE